MGVEQFDFALHARALVEQRAVKAAERAHIALREDAVFVSVLAMHGEPSLLWGVAVGRKNDAKPRNVHVAADPRVFKEHLDVWNALGAGFRSVFPANPDDDWFPQVLVASRAAWRHLHAAAERMFTVDDADARHAAETILWLAERAEHAGSQAIVVLADLLRDHYATGNPDDEDRLDEWCTWFGIDDPRQTVAWTTVDKATGVRTDHEASPDGIDEARTDPEYDSASIFQGLAGKKRSLYTVMTAARKAQEDGKVHQARNAAMRAQQPLVRTVETRFKRLVRLYARVRDDFPQPLPGLDLVAGEDARSWVRWRKSRDDGYYVARRDNVLSATIGLMSREHAADAWERLLVAGDDVAFRRAVHDGRGITGDVTAVDGRILEVTTSQPIVRARPGTELVQRGSDKPVLNVEDLRSQGADTVLVIDAGAKTDGRPELGDKVVLVPAPFDWGRASRSRASAVERLRNPPWTHQPPDTTSAPAWNGTEPPADLFAQAMGRRA